MKRIVFTGGGTAGHVTPNLALISAFQKQNWQIDYVGSSQGVEKQIITASNIPYHAIQCGKLRRYFSWNNFLDPLKILTGIVQSFVLLRKIKPNAVFSKGGFVALPVVIGAWLNRIPIIAHESDLSPGLANRLCYPFVNKICVTFEAGKSYFKHSEKVFVTGTPIREQLFHGRRKEGLALCGFKSKKPTLMVIGGSQGASTINHCIRDALSELSTRFQIIHLCGKGKLDPTFDKQEGYYQLEYANEELPDLLAASDFVISRSGANSLYEILALGKPHILIPLSKQYSRGDQIQNAAYFKKLGISTVIQEETLTKESLLKAIETLVASQEGIEKKIKALNITSATGKIVDLILETSSSQGLRLKNTLS